MGQSFCITQNQGLQRFHQVGTHGAADVSARPSSMSSRSPINRSSPWRATGAAWAAASVVCGMEALRAVNGPLSRRRRRRRTLLTAVGKETSGAVTVKPSDKDESQLTQKISSPEEFAAAFNERAEESLMQVRKEHTALTRRWNHPNWDYFDVTMIHVRAGDGGHGCKSFRREKHVPLGGPDGGNGGHGGNVYLRCAENLSSLVTLRDNTHFRAASGLKGKGKRLDGKRGRHRYVDVPPGTCVYVRDAWKGSYGTGERAGEMELPSFENAGKNLVHEFTKPGEILRVAKGGKGGRGNLAFKTQKNTAPWLLEVGQKGTQRWIEVELKLIADIGLIGVPNAGKSSLLAVATDAMPKVAPYPFTTVRPNLGYYKHDIHGGVTLCDIPGLLDGASEGRGMGHQFLRHVERCKTLIHVVSGDSEDPIGDFEMIQAELAAFSAELAVKPQVIVVNKCDIPEVRELLPELMAELRRRCGHSRVFDISAATRFHVDELMQRVYKWHKSVVTDATVEDNDDAEYITDSRTLVQYGSRLVESTDQEKISLDESSAPRGRNRRKNEFEARVEFDVLEDAWRMLHPELERVAKDTNWMFPEADERFNRVMKATGMTDALARAGIKDGEAIVVGSKQFRYSPSMKGNESRMLQYDMDLHGP